MGAWLIRRLLGAAMRMCVDDGLVIPIRFPRMAPYYPWAEPLELIENTTHFVSTWAEPVRERGYLKVGFSGARFCTFAIWTLL